MVEYPSVSLGIREMWYLVIAAIYFKPLRRTIKLFSLMSFTSKCETFIFREEQLQQKYLTST